MCTHRVIRSRKDLPPIDISDLPVEQRSRWLWLIENVVHLHDCIEELKAEVIGFSVWQKAAEVDKVVLASKLLGREEILKEQALQRSDYRQGLEFRFKLLGIILGLAAVLPWLHQAGLF